MTYDEWKTASPEYVGDDNDGCTCPRELGAGGVRKADKRCPIHGLDPDAEREKNRDDA